MSASSAPVSTLPWWKEPTKDQWYAYFAAWMGWTLDAFDFTVFLLIMAPIAQEFGVPLIDVTAVFSVTLIMRLGGATASGWLADRLGRRAPLMISILWYSFCNLAAGLSPSFTFLFVARALLGIGMGAEWPAGAALAMESWPVRSRGFMSGVLQGSWGLGFALSALAYGFLYGPLESIAPGYGWRGMLILGVLPALVCVWIRVYVKEPEVWTENKKIQDTTRKQVTPPFWGGLLRSVTAKTMAKSASLPPVIKTFCPLMTQCLPSLTAVVRMAEGSEPAPGSVRAKQDLRVPSMVGMRYSAFCCSLP